MAAITRRSIAAQLRAVTPHDTNELPNGVCNYLWIGGNGNVAVITEEDTAAVTLTGALVGTIVPIRARIVLSTGTTATNIVAMY